MKAFKRVIALSTMSAILLTSCGQPEPTPTPEATPAATQEAVATEGATADLSGEVIYMSMFNASEPGAIIFQEAIDDFMVENPNVNVTVQWMGRDISKTIKPILDSGQPLDMWDQGLDTVARDYKDYALDLTPYYAEKYSKTGDKTFEETIQPVLLETVKSISGGVLNAVPYGADITGFFYNKDHFATAGITKAPLTGQEFLVACQQLKDAGFSPMSIDDAYAILPFGTYLGRLKGPDWVKQLVNDTTGAMWDDPAVLEAAKVIEDCATKGYYSPNTLTNKYPSGQNEFALGQSSMYLVPTYMPNEVKAMAGENFNWGFFAFPETTGAILPITANSYGSSGFQIPKTSTNPDAAFALIANILSPEFDTKLSQGSVAIPTLATGGDWPAPLAEAQVVFESTTERLPYSCYLNSNSKLTPTLKAELVKLSAGASTAEEFIATAKTAVMGG